MNQKNDGKLVVIMIMVLVSFGIGAGVGISLGIDHDDPAENANNTTHIEDVTEEMTTNLTEDTQEVFIENETGVEDFNENLTFETKNESLVFLRNK